MGSQITKPLPMLACHRETDNYSVTGARYRHGDGGGVNEDHVSPARWTIQAREMDSERITWAEDGEWEVNSRRESQAWVITSAGGAGAENTSKGKEKNQGESKCPGLVRDTGEVIQPS